MPPGSGECDDGRVSSAPAFAKFRYNAALAVAAVIAVIGAIPLLAASAYFAPLLLVPAAVAIWAWRAGTDVGAEGVTVHALLGSRRIPWPEVDALVPDGRRVQARLTNGRAVTLPAVATADLPALVAASGGEASGGTDEAGDRSPQ
jgi:hypothetical protein